VSVASEALVLRPATPADGPTLWRLARDAGGLDLNSPYAYLLAADAFGATCVVAEESGEALGFVVALRWPGRTHVVFVWQVAVSPAARGRGLARRLLDALVDGPGCAGVTHLEATVTPSNAASRALFRSFARARGAACDVGPRYLPEHFPDGAHEPEELFTIGPLPEAADSPEIP